MTPTTTRTLMAPEAELEFLTDENQWCRLTLTVGDKQMALGADTFRVVVKKFLVYLESRENPKYSHHADGVDWAWIISLSERHASLFGRAVDNGYMVRVVDALGREPLRFTLSEADAQNWTQKLTTWLNEN